MPIEKTIKLYKYHELSASAKEKARDWYLSTIYWPDDLNSVLEHWREIAEKLGFTIDRNGGPWWDLHYGIFKIGRGRFYRTLDSELDRMEQEYDHNPDVLSIIHEVREIHWNFSASIEDGKIESFDIAPDYDMEPDSDDEEEWDEYYGRLKTLAEEGVERLEDALSELQYLGLKWLRDEADYLESEEYVAESMAANGWLFHEDGTRARY